MTADDLMKLIELARQNPMAALVASLPWIAMAIRWVLNSSPAPVQGTTWAKIAAVLKIIAGVLPTAKTEVKPAVPTLPPPVGVPVIRDLATGEKLQPDIPRGTLVSSVGFGRPEINFAGMTERPLLRRRVRKLAKRNGIDISELEDAEIDEAIARSQQQAGPVKDFFTWIFQNPEILLSILKLFVFAGERPNDANEVTA